jgi:hypothetical protein
VNPAVLCFDTTQSMTPQLQKFSQPLGLSPVYGQDNKRATKHVYFFQLGELRACSGKAWYGAHNKPEHELKDLEWKHTGFSVVLQLDPQGYATDRVLVLYNDSMAAMRKEASINNDAFLDSDFELPEPGRLYHGCKEQFFAAMLDLNLGQLKHKTAFKFSIKEEGRRQLQRTIFDPKARRSFTRW